MPKFRILPNMAQSPCIGSGVEITDGLFQDHNFAYWFRRRLLVQSGKNLFAVVNLAPT